MNLYSGSNSLPCLLVHGGAGRAHPSAERRERKQIDVEEIAKKAFKILRDGGAAHDAVTLAVNLLEENPIFNAGRGAVLQSDGRARLSASFMDGAKLSFSAVALAEDVICPVNLAKALQGRRNRVLTAPGVEELIAELAVPRESPITDETLATWKKTIAEGSSAPPVGTVGAVAVDLRGRLVAATSTGGFGTDVPGRMSDVPTVAGNYASHAAAVSCTGVGEQIVDAGLAVRLESRVRDGMAIMEASRRCHEEAVAKSHLFGWIALDAQGNWVAAHTTAAMAWAVRFI